MGCDLVDGNEKTTVRTEKKLGCLEEVGPTLGQKMPPVAERGSDVGSTNVTVTVWELILVYWPIKI